MACLPCCRGFLFPVAWEYFKNTSRKQRSMEERQVWEQGPDAGRMSCLHLPCSNPRPLTAVCFPLPSVPANLFVQTFKPGCLHSRAFLQETNPRFLGERSDWLPWIKPSLSFNPCGPAMVGPRLHPTLDPPTGYLWVSNPPPR